VPAHCYLAAALAENAAHAYKVIAQFVLLFAFHNPAGIGATLDLADAVVRGKAKLSAQQMRLLIELLPCHSPKLSAVAVGHFNGQDFAAQLDRAIHRSAAGPPLKLIEAQAIERDVDQCPDH
jgi:hypothetical protein